MVNKLPFNFIHSLKVNQKFVIPKMEEIDYIFEHTSLRAGEPCLFMTIWIKFLGSSMAMTFQHSEEKSEGHLDYLPALSPPHTNPFYPQVFRESTDQ